MKPWLTRQVRLVQLFLQLTRFLRAGTPSGALVFFAHKMESNSLIRCAESCLCYASYRGTNSWCSRPRRPGDHRQCAALTKHQSERWLRETRDAVSLHLTILQSQKKLNEVSSPQKPPQGASFRRTSVFPTEFFDFYKGQWIVSQHYLTIRQEGQLSSCYSVSLTKSKWKTGLLWVECDAL